MVIQFEITINFSLLQFVLVLIALVLSSSEWLKPLTHHLSAMFQTNYKYFLYFPHILTSFTDNKQY